MNFGNWLKRLPAPGMLALFYLIFIAVGAAALKLPLSHTGPITWSDAIFTSTSAVTVTGLIVLDTPAAFTTAGEGILIVLMQMGGLGLMTFAALLLSALGISFGIPQRIVLREDLNQTSLSNLMALVQMIFKLALACELIGFVLLSIVFVPDFGWATGMWHALFHAVSAFNNAGFSTFSNSLSDYATDPIVTLTVPGLFIVSGLGFVVLADVAQKRAWRPLALHSKLMLAGTPVLIVAAFAGFAALEWNNPGTLGAVDGGPLGKLQAAFFQAVTPRTAGFNTVNTTAMRDSTALMTMALMVIGGGSTSTAGGIKLTTAAVLVLATLAFFKRRKELSAFGRAIRTEEVQKVMALTTVSVILVFSGLFLLTIFNDSSFLVLSFEVASAFGTVGLSIGATGTLEGWGRSVIIVIMFLGRVGPLVLGFFLATQAAPRVRYPKGQIYLG